MPIESVLFNSNLCLPSKPDYRAWAQFFE
jgi:hypothetical protein